MSIKAPSETVPTTAVGVVARPSASTWAELFKARLTLLVLITTAVGFHFGSKDGIGGWLFFHTLAGTALLAAGAAALNQYWERGTDALMARTSRRPLPAGMIEPGMALAVGVGLAIVGMLQLTFLVNPLTGLLGMVTLASYVFIYTPLKRKTTLNTVIGAIPGALPPLMGWTAATGQVDVGGWALFTLLFFWQLPHFMAIAWLYRDDYARAGFRMLPVVDPDGRRTGMTAVRHTVALLAFSLAPVALGNAGRIYAVVALVLGCLFLACSIAFAVRLSRESARRLFLASIVYLPLVLGVLVADKVSDTSRASHRQGGVVLVQPASNAADNGGGTVTVLPPGQP